MSFPEQSLQVEAAQKHLHLRPFLIGLHRPPPRSPSLTFNDTGMASRCRKASRIRQHRMEYQAIELHPANAHPETVPVRRVNGQNRFRPRLLGEKALSSRSRAPAATGSPGAGKSSRPFHPSRLPPARSGPPKASSPATPEPPSTFLAPRSWWLPSDPFGSASRGVASPVCSDPAAADTSAPCCGKHRLGSRLPCCRRAWF